MTELRLAGPPPTVRPEYQQAAAWAAEVHGGLRESRRVAWLAATAAVLAAGLLGVALATVGPLRSAVPHSVLVDRQAGQAHTVHRLAPGALVRDPAMVESAVARYVMAREGFDPARLAADYRLVSLWSDPRARAQYDAEITRTNPASLLAQYGAGASVTPAVKSVSLLSPTQALVRFDTVRSVVGATTGEQQSWRATIVFSFDPGPMRNEERFANPLGFRVSEYRRASEGVLPVQVGLAAR